MLRGHGKKNAKNATVNAGAAFFFGDCSNGTLQKCLPVDDYSCGTSISNLTKVHSLNGMALSH